MNIETEKIGNNILLLTFDTRYEMGMTMVRLQEYYESPEFKGKFFWLEDFIDYWCKEHGKGGAFDYPVRWRGYNLPSGVIKDWMKNHAYEHNGSFTDLVRPKEVQLLDVIHYHFGKKADEWEDFYVIAVSKSESEEDRADIIDHELSHALYNLNPEYRGKCQEILEEDFADDTGGKIKLYMKLCLNQKGYHEDVFDDETVAYLATGKPEDAGLDDETSKHRGITALRDNFKMFKTG
jgi:hypothetical protein